MAVPFVQQYKVGKYIFGQKLKRNKRYPLVLMLEPLFRCNLACAGCGKIDYPDHILDKRLSYDDCMTAVEECGAPIVSIAGGEPLIHKEMNKIVAGFIERKKFVYLCTNALLLERHMDYQICYRDSDQGALRVGQASGVCLGCASDHQLESHGHGCERRDAHPELR